MPNAIASFSQPLTPLARRVVGVLTAFRSVRTESAGLRADITALFARLGFNPAAPTPETAAAVVAAVGLASADDLPAALTTLAELGALDLSTPLSRVNLP